MVCMLAREGDFIQHKSGIIFDVKGLMHPKNKIVAFPRYIPNTNGSRHNENICYDKIYNLKDRFQFLQEHLPNLLVFDEVFGETLCEVPTNEVTRHFQPLEKLAYLRIKKPQTLIEEKALQLATELQQTTNIPWHAIGISGSILTDLTTPTSDIDLIIYGKENSQKTYTTLQHIFKNNHPNIKAYTIEELRTLYDFRSKDTHMSFEDFQYVENRKAFQGMYKDTDFFIRFIKDWPELTKQYGDVYYSDAGYVKITATINNTTDALFTPCTYQLKNVKTLEGTHLTPIKEVSSFRGRFCQQAENRETITAQGKAERVINKKNGKTYYRLLIGSKPQDYMIINNLMHNS